MFQLAKLKAEYKIEFVCFPELTKAVEKSLEN